MATDRMSAYRASHHTDQMDEPSHEMTTLLSTGSGGQSLVSMPEFLAETSSVQDSIGRFSADVTRISALNARSLDALAEDAPAIQEELDALMAQTMEMSTELKDRIKQLQAAVLPGVRGKQEKEMRQTRVTHVRTKFTEALQTYQQVGQDHRSKSRQRVERQYRIVKPDATQAEITEAISSGGAQVFMQALTTSPRYAQSQSAYHEVKVRAQDLKKMEQTLGELAQLFSNMALLVEQQDEALVEIESVSHSVEKDVEQGLADTTQAVTFARSARGKRWICLGIALAVIIVIVIIVVILVRHQS